MAWSPEQLIDQTVELARLYADSETKLLETIARRVGEDMDQPHWAELKLADINRLQSELDAEVRRLAEAGQVEISDLIERGYAMGSNGMADDLNRAVGGINTSRTFTTADRRRIEALVNETLGLTQSTHNTILRRSQDIYRTVIADVSRLGVAGVDTRREVAQRALNQFANRGITSFVDSAGRHWDMATYSEMATRTSMARAAIQGAEQRLTENGYDLVVVSSIDEACPLCDEWETAILSLSGTSDTYPSVDAARDAGLFHPACRHAISSWIPGLTEKPERKPKQQRETRYDATQTQRYNERTIRQWKRRESVALDDQSQQAARRKVREWQGRQREHVAEHDLVRKYERESLTRAR